ILATISDRVLQVLDLMDTLHLNLPLFLWAISWNVPKLISNNRVRFARTALMVSDELPGILAHCHRPPCSHGQGICTKATRKALNDWALETIYLSEEVLLSISWKEMIPEVKSKAPTLWKRFRYTLYTPRQEEQNQLKDPDMVQFNDICFWNF
ncbi:hypothetical protein L208DRAFT_1394424, partial [Tricholoma matsutake]